MYPHNVLVLLRENMWAQSFKLRPYMGSSKMKNLAASLHPRRAKVAGALETWQQSLGLSLARQKIAVSGLAFELPGSSRSLRCRRSSCPSFTVPSQTPRSHSNGVRPESASPPRVVLTRNLFSPTRVQQVVSPSLPSAPPSPADAWIFCLECRRPALADKETRNLLQYGQSRFPSWFDDVITAAGTHVYQQLAKSWQGAARQHLCDQSVSESGATKSWTDFFSFFFFFTSSCW